MTYHLARALGLNDTVAWLSTPTSDIEEHAHLVSIAEGRTLRAALTYGRASQQYVDAKAIWDDALTAQSLALSRVDPTVSSIEQDVVFKVDSEFIVVRFAGEDAVEVGRAGFGTHRATHAAGAAVTAVTLRVVASFDVELLIEGSPVSSGDKGDVSMAEAGTVVSVKLIADQPGDLVLDVQRAAFAEPTLGSFTSIVGASFPTLSGEQTYLDESLVGWSTSYSRGDVLRFVVLSAATVTRVTAALTCSTAV